MPIGSGSMRLVREHSGMKILPHNSVAKRQNFYPDRKGFTSPGTKGAKGAISALAQGWKQHKLVRKSSPRGQSKKGENGRRLESIWKRSAIFSV